MKVTPFFEEIVELTAAFLDTLGETKTADRLRVNYQLPEWVSNQNPILMKGLIKILKEYSRSQTSITNYLTTRQNPEEIVQSKPKIEKRKKSEQIVQQRQWMNRFQKPRKLQQLNDLVVEVQQQKPKKKKARILQKQEIESEELDSDSFQLQSKKSKKIQKKQKVQKKKKEKKQIPQEIKKSSEHQSPVTEQEQEEQKFQPITARNPYKNGVNGYKQSFSRINAEQVGRIREELRDNSFQAKQRYGQAGDKWGQYGYEKLKDTRGDSFKKTKGKLKNKSFQGTFMDINKINSIPIY